MGKSPAGLPSHPYPHLGTDQPPESAFDTDEFPLEIFLKKESLSQLHGREGSQQDGMEEDFAVSLH